MLLSRLRATPLRLAAMVRLAEGVRRIMRPILGRKLAGQIFPVGSIQLWYLPVTLCEMVDEGFRT